MDGEAIIAVAAAVVTLTQMAKWGGIPDRWGPAAVLVLAAIGVGLWGWSAGTFQRETTFAYFAGWITVSSSAAGVFGFIRAGRDGVTAMKNAGNGGGA